MYLGKIMTLLIWFCIGLAPRGTYKKVQNIDREKPINVFKDNNAVLKFQYEMSVKTTA